MRIITLASTVFKKSTFQKKKSNLNAIGSKFDLDLKKVKVNLGLSFGRPHIPNATYQVPISQAFWFWGRFFKRFLHTFCLTYHKESPHEIRVQLGQWFVRKLCFNILMRLQYERPKLKGQMSTLTLGTYL